MSEAQVRERLTRPADEVAPDLLGWTLRHTTQDGTVAIVLTEVEAYLGEADPASHAYRGPTGRNAVMFGVAGHLYTYRSYGIHWCCNVVTGVDGRASAVLLRAGRVVEGHDLARERRGPRVAERALARGPGCLAQALGLSSEQYGADLIGDGPVRLRPGATVDSARVGTGHRVGVRLAADVPWRFWLDGEPSVSAYRRSPRAPA
ncbi:DNA-3-methyladenine glycosylase [Solicola gregarius]|uniref:Putative 3-methyladenine DNA glycosylase n=1 Tax=Solicola gregarius TaxID=2908642 RepID=A0AA46YL26_9ACTN|nr:DNA-3-methyladenine glycosylase [Solicola gregarius]UYM05204.1 DNA-3-methyladenine glycosylase [Solicola gregarius]